MKILLFLTLWDQLFKINDVFVNDSLKFHMVILQIHQLLFLMKNAFFNAKDSHICFNKNNSVFNFEFDIHVTIEG